MLDLPLVQAAQNVVPVAVTAAESVDRLRTWASGRCLNADQPGIYVRESTQPCSRRTVVCGVANNCSLDGHPVSLPAILPIEIIDLEYGRPLAAMRLGLCYDAWGVRDTGIAFTDGGTRPMIEDDHQPYDRSSKWLVQHHGDSMLWLASVRNIRAWRPAQAEVVQPRRLPDALLEVRLEDETEDDLFLLEVATYPERRVGQQMTDDLLLVYLDRGQLPEAVTLVLRPKGKYRVPRSRNLRSRRGLSSCHLKWHVVELWTIPAEELLQAGDVGLIPWVPLTDFADPPETMLQRCREAIEGRAPPGEKANLLAVTQVFSFLRYNDLALLTVLGGKEVMLEVPFLDEIVMEKTRATACETVRQDVVTVLEARFGDVPRDVSEEIESVVDTKQLRGLVRLAASCPDLDAFRSGVVQKQS